MCGHEHNTGRQIDGQRARGDTSRRHVVLHSQPLGFMTRRTESAFPWLSVPFDPPACGMLRRRPCNLAVFPEVSGTAPGISSRLSDTARGNGVGICLQPLQQCFCSSRSSSDGGGGKQSL